MERIGSSAIVSTWAGRGELKAVRHIGGQPYGQIELLKGGTLQVPVEQAVTFEVVGKQAARKPQQTEESKVSQLPPQSYRAPAIDSSISAVTSTPSMQSKFAAGGGRSPGVDERTSASEAVTAVVAMSVKVPHGVAVVAGASLETGRRDVAGVREARRSKKKADEPCDGGVARHHEPLQLKVTEAKPAANAAPELAQEDSAIVGEWRHGEKIITVRQSLAGLSIVLVTVKKPLDAERKDDKYWHARSSDEFYELRFDGKNRIHLSKADDAFFANRVAQTKSLQGKWAHSDKTFDILVEDGRLVLCTTGKEAQVKMPLLRRALVAWEASAADSGEPVYIIEHSEGSQKILMRRPAAAKGVEFLRADVVPSAAPRDVARSVGQSQRSWSQRSRRRRSRSRQSQRRRERGRSSSRSCRRSNSGSSGGVSSSSDDRGRRRGADRRKGKEKDRDRGGRQKDKGKKRRREKEKTRNENRIKKAKKD